MRVLLTVNPAASHFFTMVPLAWSLHLDGHQVIVAAPRVLTQCIRRAGLTAAVAGGDATFFSCWPGGTPLTGQPMTDLTVFAAVAERMLPDVLALTQSWRPDLIVSDPVEFAGPVAAAKAGVPWVRHEWGLPVPEHLMAAARAEVADRLAALGPADEPIAVVDTCPPSLRAQAPGPTVRPMRYVPYSTACTAPGWLSAPPERPRIAVSMGTVPIAEGVDGLTAAVRGLADLDAEVIVSGSGAEALTDLPANVRRIGWVPHHLLLPGCALLVHHGGSNSAMAALTAGVPHLVMPQMGDQFEIADRLTGAGVARTVPFDGRTPEAVAAAARALLSESGHGLRAAALRVEIAAMPSPAAVVTDGFSS
ncbi:nucleotide disphospho-sugar-binding domain-containing protein [Paractinoplanes lichenicola]|uniref:DUF1205 domain-containing protein n=1 Tax=Paractinoplanes lichenicola TaxID=2802976 RepID=A0ABS1VE70_9ACTN|nr:nucleotide disphospho-sugar-binding domain-containing protein [Actinoplanes lichenicola]MBL7252928.1 DUF1205 domain-containing protein [Actinoplanes lichenicola]